MCCRQFSLNLEVEFDNDPGAFGGLATNRKCTDIFGLFVMVLYLGTVIGLCVYCIQNSDVKKVLNGYDDSGNICGKNNKKSDSMLLKNSGEDMEQKKYVLIKEDPTEGKTKECVENCTMQDTILVYNYCVTDKKFLPYYMEILEYWKFILLTWFCVAILVLSINQVPYWNMKMFLQYMKCYLPFYIFVIFIFFWVQVSLEDFNKNSNFFLVFLTFGIIITIAFVLSIPWFCNEQMTIKINLLTQLYEEIFETFNVKRLFFLPFLFSTIIAGLTILLIYLWIWLQSFSYFDEIYSENGPKVVYVQYTIATITGALSIYTYLLIYEVLKNFQVMVVAGYVAQMYFTKKDDEASQPFRKSVSNLLRYHLGTVCCGSLILPFCYVLRSVVNAIKGATSGYNKESVYNCSCRILSDTCLAAFITFLDIFTQNGFTMTAIYGCSYCKGTIRAHKLINHNVFNVASIYAIDDIFLVYLKMTMIVNIILIYFILQFVNIFPNLQLVSVIGGNLLLSYILIDCYFSVIKVILNTMFLCFCEDCLYNNGASKPYYMTPVFAKFIENANKYVNPIKWKEVEKKWESGPKHSY